MRPVLIPLLLGAGLLLCAARSASAQAPPEEKPGTLRVRSAGRCQVRVGDRAPVKLAPRESTEIKLAPGQYVVAAESGFAKLKKDYDADVASGQTAELVVDFSATAREALAARGVTADPAAMQDAVGRNQSDVLRLLLDAGLAADQRDGEERPLLLVAADLGHRDALQALLEAGPELDATDRLGRTAVMWAALRGHAELVGDLVAQGADLNHKDKVLKDTALMLAAAWGHRGVVTVLVETGLVQTRRSGVVGTIFGKGGLDLDETNRLGWNAVMYAARYGHTGIAGALVEAGAKADRRDELQRTAAMLALAEGHAETAGYLDSLAARPK
jgi:ankyrin repeat protein